MSVASVGIFTRKIEIGSESGITKTVPNELFEAVKRVIENQSEELLRTNEGYFLVTYSATGPFTQFISHEWLPVKVVRFTEWTAGGITQGEMQSHEHSEVNEGV